MRLTDEQRAAVKADGHTVVVACPGSGKTRTLIAKLLRCVDDVRDSPRRVGCITYTNTAVYEIEHRLRLYGSTGDEDYCDVSTIHSFCQNNVLRFFYWMLPEYINGYMILPPDCERYSELVAEVGDKFGLSPFVRSTFEMLNRRPDGSPIAGDIPPAAAMEFWSRLQAEGYIDFCNIVYYTYRLLKDNPSVVNAISCRFAHLLVDEFQDTSALQVEIFSLIADRGRTSFFLVGDPEQSIYSFAGAEPSLMDQFATRLNANRNAQLLGNFRSSGPIVACAEKIRPRNPRMYASGESTRYTEEPFHVDAAATFEAMTDYFIPMLDELGINYGEAAILAPQWPILRPLGGKLRDFKVPVVGPGARPYKRSHLFARLAEQMCAFIEQPKHETLRQAEKELFTLILNVTGRAEYLIYTYSGRRLMYSLLNAGRDIAERNEGGVAWLREASQNIGAMLNSHSLLPMQGCKLLDESVEGMLADMEKARIDVNQLAIGDLGMFADPEKSIKLMTIHAAKGREFDAVALVGLQDGIIPYYNDYTPPNVEEGRRLFYVAATRARRVLMLVTEKEHQKERCRYLKEIGL